MEGKFADALSPINIDARQHGVLLFIKENPNSSQKTISERLQIDRTTMVSHVDHLETLYFVERTKNPCNRSLKDMAFYTELFGKEIGNKIIGLVDHLLYVRCTRISLVINLCCHSSIL